MILPTELTTIEKRSDGADVVTLVAEVRRLSDDLLNARLYAADARLALHRVLAYFDALDEDAEDEVEAEKNEEELEPLSPEEEARRDQLLNEAQDAAESAMARDKPNDVAQLYTKLLTLGEFIGTGPKRDRLYYIEAAREMLDLDAKDSAARMLVRKDLEAALLKVAPRADEGQKTQEETMSAAAPA